MKMYVKPRICLLMMLLCFVTLSYGMYENLLNQLYAESRLPNSKVDFKTMSDELLVEYCGFFIHVPFGTLDILNQQLALNIVARGIHLMYIEVMGRKVDELFLNTPDNWEVMVQKFIKQIGFMSHYFNAATEDGGKMWGCYYDYKNRLEGYDKINEWIRFVHKNLKIKKVSSGDWQITKGFANKVEKLKSKVLNQDYDEAALIANVSDRRRFLEDQKETPTRTAKDINLIDKRRHMNELDFYQDYKGEKMPEYMKGTIRCHLYYFYLIDDMENFRKYYELFKDKVGMGYM